MTSVPGSSVHQPDVVYVEGPLLAPLKSELAQRVRARLRRGARSIVVDLGRVSAIDAGGIGELVSAYNMTVAANGALQVVHASAFVREILQRVGLLDVLSRERLSDRRPRGRMDRWSCRLAGRSTCT